MYALVRVADEIVDGASAGSGVSPEEAWDLLQELEAETLASITRGFSTNLVVHAFSLAARQADITDELISPFFASMRADLDLEIHSDASLDQYVYGSAEVVGLMCLKIFLASSPVGPGQEKELVSGARRLGAAFQKINFLRDLSQDYIMLGRVYIPGTTPQVFNESIKNNILDDIQGDLIAARAVIDDLPDNSRTAVLVAHDLFAELARRLRATPADDLLTVRVRVPDTYKVFLLARAMGTARAVPWIKDITARHGIPQSSRSSLS